MILFPAFYLLHIMTASLSDCVLILRQSGALATGTIISTPSLPATETLLAPVSEAHSFGLLPRDSVCGGSTDLTQCGFGLPSGWCCPASTICLPLNNTGTITSLCCPKGSDCSIIQPITCNTTEQNPSTFPSSSLHSADLTKALPLCGSKCCPLGFSCSSSGTCTMDAATKQAPKQNPASNSGTSSNPAPTASSTRTGAGNGGAGSSGSALSSGAIGGIVITAAVVATAFVASAVTSAILLWRHRRRSKVKSTGIDHVLKPELSENQINIQRSPYELQSVNDEPVELDAPHGLSEVR
jgi:hypothetical protein